MERRPDEGTLGRVAALPTLRDFRARMRWPEPSTTAEADGQWAQYDQSVRKQLDEVRAGLVDADRPAMVRFGVGRPGAARVLPSGRWWTASECGGCPSPPSPPPAP